MNRVISVACPCCNKELCRAEETRVDEYLPPATGLQIKDDKEGFFVLCPHCKKRIAINPSFAGQKDPVSFSVADQQNCGQ